MSDSVANLSLIALFAAGHTSLMIAIANRLHGLGITKRMLRTGDALITTVAAGLVWWVWTYSGALLRGSWSHLPVLLLAYLLVCGVVACALPVIALARSFRGFPVAHVRQTSRTIDIARRLGYRPVGRGPSALTSWFPGNEIFRLEVAEKEYRLPRVPTAWDGLSILHLTDVHFLGTLQREFYEQVFELGMELRPDLIVFTGDLLDRADLVHWLPETFGRLSAPLGCYYVLGNHDWTLGDTSPTRQKLQELGWHDVAGRTVTIEHADHPLVIGGSEAPWMGRHPDFSHAPTDAFRLLLSHTPDNLPWARRQGVDLMLAGHNHGGQVRLPGFGPIYTPSIFGGRYASGVFQEDPTLLYVGRGISGKTLLRLLCPPELTKFVLRPQVATGDRQHVLGTRALSRT